MNERKPYEQTIAEKLQQLPAPDADTSWQQMKRLLDDDDSPAGGAGGKNFRPGKGWWRAGIIAIVITAALWIYTENRKSATKEIASNKTLIENNAINSTRNNNASSATTGRNKSTISPGNNNVPVASNKSINTNTSNNSTATNNSAVDKETGKTSNNAPAVGNNNTLNTADNKIAPKEIKAITKKDNNTLHPVANNNTAAIKKNHQHDIVAAAELNSSNSNTIKTKKDTENRNFFAKQNMRSSGTGPYRINNTRHNNTGGTDDVAAGKNNYRSTGNRKDVGNSTAKIINGNTGNSNDKQNIIAVQSETTIPHGQEKYIGFDELMLPYRYDGVNTTLASGDSVGNKQRAVALNKETNNAVAKAQREAAATIAAKKERKSINLADVFKPFSLKTDGEPWWAVGLSMNSSLAVGSQSSYNYNINAKSNTWSDYLPSPFVQYHLNDNVYLQTELNLSTPQSVPQLLMSQNITTIQGSQDRIQSSIYVQKLYYFNWPFSLHYSPVSNLYIAGGLQFSSLQSGIALKENRTISGSSPGNVSSTIYKFKDDSTAAKLSPNEWRWETGADYYWNRFTLGFRYNKSLKDLVNLNVSNTLTINRNEAFLLFMKYNLFEGRKRDNAPASKSLVQY